MVLHSFISRTQKVQCTVRRAQEVGDGEAEGVGVGEFLYETVVCPLLLLAYYSYYSWFITFHRTCIE